MVPSLENKVDDDSLMFLGLPHISPVPSSLPARHLSLTNFQKFTSYQPELQTTVEGHMGMTNQHNSTKIFFPVYSGNANAPISEQTHCALRGKNGSDTVNKGGFSSAHRTELQQGRMVFPGASLPMRRTKSSQPDGVCLALAPGRVPHVFFLR